MLSAVPAGLVTVSFRVLEWDKCHQREQLWHVYTAMTLDDKRFALQMGTSVRMIEQHYGHDEIHDYEDELAG